MSDDGGKEEKGRRRRPKQMLAEPRENLHAFARRLETTELRVPTAAECHRDLRGNLRSAGSHGHVHHPRNLDRVRSLATRKLDQVPSLGDAQVEHLFNPIARYNEDGTVKSEWQVDTGCSEE